MIASDIRNSRRWYLGLTYAIIVPAISIAVWATFGGFARTSRSLSRTEQAHVIQNMTPVTAAIRRYETAYRHPPVTLAALVPDYLAKIPPPSPTICSGQDYLYAVERNQWRLGVAVRGERDGVLTYSSIGDYPAGKPGTSVERVGAWAYYHGNPY